MNNPGRIFLFFVSFLFFIACSKNEGPVIPPFDPEIVAEIHGAEVIHYEAQGTVGTSANGKEIIFGSTSVINNIRYGLAMTFIFKDKPKTGTLTIANKSNAPDSDYAVAAFTVGEDVNSKVYISYSGSATLTNIQGTKLYGSFIFNARNEKSPAEIQVSQGILQANQ